MCSPFNANYLHYLTFLFEKKKVFRLWCVNIGCVDYVKKVTNANSCMSTI